MIAHKHSLFLVLLGTLGFSLSSLPGQSAEAVQERSMASNESAVDSGPCDFKSAIGKTLTGKAYCPKRRIQLSSGVYVDATVSVKKVKETTYDQTQETAVAKTSVKFEADVDLEECNTCYTTRHVVHLSLPIELSELAEINGKIETFVQKNANSIAADEIAMREKADKIEAKNAQIRNCKVGDDATKMDCFVNRFNAAKTDDAAAVLLQDAEPILDHMIQAKGKAGETSRALAKEYISMFTKIGVMDSSQGGGKVVKSDLAMLSKAAESNDKAAVLEKRIDAFKDNPAMKSLLQNASLQYVLNALSTNNWFNNQIALNAQNPLTGGGSFDYTQSIANNAALIQAELNQGFAPTLAQPSFAGIAQNLNSTNQIGLNNLTAGNTALNPTAMLLQQIQQQQQLGLNTNGIGGTGAQTFPGARAGTLNAALLH